MADHMEIYVCWYRLYDAQLQDQQLLEQMTEETLKEKYEIILDFHCINYEFTQVQNFNAKKTKTFLEMMNYIFERSMTERVPKDQAMVLFKTICLKYSVQRPPFSLFVFNLNEVKAMTDFVQHTFLKYYFMYQYAIVPKLQLDLAHERTTADLQAPAVVELETGQQVKPKEIPDLAEYFNEDDLQRMATPRQEEAEGENADGQEQME